MGSLNAACGSRPEFLDRLACLLAFCAATRTGLALVELDQAADEDLLAAFQAIRDECCLLWQGSDTLYAAFPNPSSVRDLTFSAPLQSERSTGASPGTIAVQNPVHSPSPEYWFRHLLFARGRAGSAGGDDTRA